MRRQQRQERPVSDDDFDEMPERSSDHLDRVREEFEDERSDE